MSPRFNLDDSVAYASDVPPAVVQGVPPARRRQLAIAEWDGATTGQLMLFVPDEPLIGDEFSYNGIRWQVVDYRDGWIARILL